MQPMLLQMVFRPLGAAADLPTVCISCLGISVQMGGTYVIDAPSVKLDKTDKQRHTS